MIFRYFKENYEELAVDGKNPFTALTTKKKNKVRVSTSTNQEEEQGTSINQHQPRRRTRYEYQPAPTKKKNKVRVSGNIKNPSMISAETDLMVDTFKGLTNETWSDFYRSKAEACQGLLRDFLKTTHDENHQNVRLMRNALELVNELQETAQNQEERWERIGNNWMKMFGYAARKSKSNNHTQQLRRGGEFITHVWLLMAYFGLTDHFLLPSRSLPPLLKRLIAK
ncbi:hypothetical protein QYF36_018090 [Acer negundo]|nr:hypothetical protein QYF36_018090 [Acer negundo]